MPRYQEVSTIPHKFNTFMLIDNLDFRLSVDLVRLFYLKKIIFTSSLDIIKGSLTWHLPGWLDLSIVRNKLSTSFVANLFLFVILSCEVVVIVNLVFVFIRNYAMQLSLRLSCLAGLATTRELCLTIRI